MYPERKRESIYYIATSHYLDGNYSKARRVITSLIDIEPDNTQAIKLKELIESKSYKGKSHLLDGIVGMALVGGIAAAAAGAFYAFTQKKRN